MYFIRHFFRSKPVITLALFVLGTVFLSRDPWVQRKKAFMPFHQILKRIPGLPKMPQFPEPVAVSKQGGLLLPIPKTGRTRALSRFYKKLDSLKRTGKGKIRILHYGDSILWGDNVSRRIRANLTEVFGDGGRGLLPVAFKITDYKLDGVRQAFSPDWRIRNLMTTQPGKTPLGITLRRYTAGTAGISSWTFEKENAVRTVTFFMEELKRDARLTVRYSDNNVEQRTLPAGSGKSIRIRFKKDVTAITLNTARGAVFYGASFEDGNGIVYSPVIRKGIFAQDFCSIEKNRFTAQMKIFRPDLVLFQFGKNESGWKLFSDIDHEKGIRCFVSMIRKAAPGCDLILVGPAARLYRDRSGMKLYSTINTIRSIQKRVAKELGLGYYDTYTVLDGVQGMKNMVARGLAMTDYVHLTGKGGDILGDRVTKDLLTGYGSWLKTRGQTDGGLLKYFSKPKSSRETEQQTATSQVNFDTVGFVFFFVAVFLLYWIMAGTGMLRLAMLLIASYYFYMSWNPVFITLIILSTIVDFIAGKLIDRARTEGRKGAARSWLVISLVSNLSLLFFFKYFNLFADFVARLGGPQFSFISLILPAGISFYTFQTMSYSLDIYAGKLKPVHSFLDFALFVSFFPQLVAGPIVRARDFLPQIKKKPIFNPVLVQQGLFLIAIGIFKKVVLSDQIAVNFVDRVFKSPEMYSSLENLFAVYGYGLQIYCDFSGYSDIAIGAAAMLGFHLPLNFNSPYKAVSLQDFWRRWHISLSTWLRDYLYIPLGGSRRGRIRTYANLLITMLLGGLWHGPAYRFIIWGALHGSGLAIVRWFQRFRIARGFKGTSIIGKLLGWLLTFHFVSFAWIFFRAKTMDKAGKIISRIGEGTTHLPNVTLVVAAVLLGGYLLHLVPEKWYAGFKRLFVRMPSPVQALFLLILAVIFYKTAIKGVVPFTYFQF